jgi:dTDP-4-dehydrorhamnose 3,5-epimerase
MAYLNVIETPIRNCYLLKFKRNKDERGWFATLASEEAKFHIAEVCQSYSQKKGTLRGLHYQSNKQAKIVRCTRGGILDVVLDLRPESRTYLGGLCTYLTAKGDDTISIPPGCAHGFITTHKNTEVLYFLSSPYDPIMQRGVRWDDPAFNIPWPQKPTCISERDTLWPDFKV